MSLRLGIITRGVRHPRSALASLRAAVTPAEPVADLQRLVPEAATIFDVGAFRGSVAQELLVRYPRATVHAFEPHPDSIHLLRELASAEPRLVPVHAAVAEHAGRVSLNTGPRPYTSSLLERPQSGPRYYAEDAPLDGVTEVDSVTLDGYAERLGVWPEILKVDVQGGELAALRGADRCLRSSTRAALVELQFVPLYDGAPRPDEVAAFLADRGFRLVRFYGLHHAADGQLVFGDGLFVR